MSTTSAQVILNDDFSTTNQVNMIETNAYYDSNETLFRLPKIQVPQSLALAEYGNEYALINGDTVQFFQYDDGINQWYNRLKSIYRFRILLD